MTCGLFAIIFLLGGMMGRTAPAIGPVDVSDLGKNFLNPPDSARPWVYWFWNNANVTKVGITADLEAMKRAGIGGVIIMDVVERFAPPRGTAEFMNPEWRELFRFAVAEAKRLGLEINMTNGPGWCGSSGPWITEELSRQMLISTNITVTGPTNFSGELPRAALPSRHHDGFNSTVEYKDFYRDVAVLAIPDATNGVIPREAVVDLTDKLEAGGKLNWQVPPGNWTILRIGHTTTGSSTRPPVVGGNGLECDKLSREAMDVHFAAMIGRLITEVGPMDGTALVATHIDSWEVGSQNWTPKLREEFQKRRGYDPIPFLPDVLGGDPKNGNAFRVGRNGAAERFFWDFQETRSELLAENYSGRLAELAHQHGMRLTMEGYDLPFGDEATYTARVDEPMSEFWMNTSWANEKNQRKGRQMASVAHVYGHAIVGAEAFTSDDHEKWMQHPATIKSLGDFEFCQGINRFVVHRFAHQPYLDRFPGATMGPWGLHYERTQTWWEMSKAWHEYLARCQFMLRQGLFVADLCYLRPELPDQTYFNPMPAVPAGYKYDEISAEALIARMAVRDGRLVLPDGMSYRILILPPVTTMTPALARKLKQLVTDGAIVLAESSRPLRSPSLAEFPKCDDEVSGLTAELWGNCDAKAVTEHALGAGRVIWGQGLAEVLHKLQAPADFSAEAKLNWIHRGVEDGQIYFVANPAKVAVETTCHFRVKNLSPELWNPMTGERIPIAVYQPSIDGISIPLHFEPSGSWFVVFRKQKAFDPVISFTRDGQPVFAPTKPTVIQVQKATYGVPGDAARSRDVTSKLQALAAGGVAEFQVSELARGDDPAFGIVKTLVAEMTVDGRATKLTGHDPDTVTLIPERGAEDRAAEVRRDGDKLSLMAREPGRYELRTAAKTMVVEVTSVPAPVELSGAWNVSFPPRWGAPEKITFEKLESWSDSTNSGVKYFSGTAAYAKTFDWKPGKLKTKPEVWLDLGDVQVMALVTLNGRDLGILWKPPFRVNVTGALRPGDNMLEVRVANLWPNRMIGDAALPVNQRFTWSSWEPFTKDMPLLKSGLLGPVRLISGVVIPAGQ
jgi:hypothetical protein